MCQLFIVIQLDFNSYFLYYFVIFSYCGRIMKKFFMSLYIFILAFILYQLILGKNGLLEGYRLTKEAQALDRYISYLKIDNAKLKDNVDFLRKNPGDREELANKMGFFKEPVTLYRIIKEDDKPVFNISQSDSYLSDFVEANIKIETINKIRIYINIGFYSIVSLFILLIVFGGSKE